MSEEQRSKVAVERLCRLLEHDSQLTVGESEAFSNMQCHVNRSKRLLTARQCEWIEKVYMRLGLDAEEGSANLVSSGIVKVTAAERVPKFSWELPENRPLKPPGTIR